MDTNFDLPFDIADAASAAGKTPALWVGPVNAVRDHAPALIGRVGAIARANPVPVLAVNLIVAAAIVLRMSPTARHYVIGKPVAAAGALRAMIHRATAPKAISVTEIERRHPSPVTDEQQHIPAAHRRTVNGAGFSPVA
jgi:hypothetical protein